MTAETLSPEERARAIIPMHYRAETAATSVMPSMEMVLSSRCAGALRDAIASAIRQAVADERERCARVAEAAERSWNARITPQGRISDSDVYASGAANASSEIAAALRARATDTRETDNG